MSDFAELFENISIKAEINANVSENDFMKDGLLHCGDCRTPKQTKIFLFGLEKTVFCQCKCAYEKYEAKQEKTRHEQEQIYISRLKTQGIQDKQIREWTFANDDNRNPAMMNHAMRYFTKWKQMYAENLGILLWGNVGTGKTYFAACIANSLLDSGVPVLMTSFSKIINALSGFSVKDKNAYIDDFCRYKLLVIDDLGAERQSEYAQEIVYSVIDARYKDRQPLIITTNMTLDSIKNPKDIVYSRIYDRIQEMCTPINYKGDSRRQVKYQDKIDRAKIIFSD